MTSPSPAAREAIAEAADRAILHHWHKVRVERVVIVLLLGLLGSLAVGLGLGLTSLHGGPTAAGTDPNTRVERLVDRVLERMRGAQPSSR